MRYTGIALMIIGACILAFCMIAGLTTGQPPQYQQDVATSKLDLMFPAVMGVVAAIVGAAMYYFGGRGYVHTYDPAIRN